MSLLTGLYSWYLLLYEECMFFEESAEEEGKVLYEVLFVILPILVGFPDVCAQRKHLEGGRRGGGGGGGAITVSVWSGEGERVVTVSIWRE